MRPQEHVVLYGSSLWDIRSNPNTQYAVDEQKSFAQSGGALEAVQLSLLSSFEARSPVIPFPMYFGGEVSPRFL